VSRRIHAIRRLLRKFAVEAFSSRADRIPDMTTLIQTSEIHPRSTTNRNVDATGSANTHSARIGPFGLCALAAIVSGLIAAVIIALQTAFSLHSLHY
jgi:hypothetical protein